MDSDTTKNKGTLEDNKENNETTFHLTQIKSKDSSHSSDPYEFLVTCANESNELNIEEVHSMANYVRPISNQRITSASVPWFPLKIEDLDNFAEESITNDVELDSDHPGFTDLVYRERRNELAEIALKYSHGQAIPRVKYTEAEIKIWGTVFDQLTELYPTHACREFNDIFPVMVEKCGYRRDSIPQLEDISNFLKDRTGFTLIPVAGFVSIRKFLAGLAFRVVFCTQYIRHGSRPTFTPEPDVCHDTLGHVPFFADPTFAQISQEIGLASLGASDSCLKKLAKYLWFTLEFGLCMQDGEVKAYGGGLLSSVAELKYSLADRQEKKPFNSIVSVDTKYTLTTFQPIYLVSESFEDAMEKLRKYAAEMPRPFSLRYDPHTQSVAVLENNVQLENVNSTK